MAQTRQSSQQALSDLLNQVNTILSDSKFEEDQNASKARNAIHEYYLRAITPDSMIMVHMDLLKIDLSQIMPDYKESLLKILRPEQTKPSNAAAFFKKAASEKSKDAAPDPMSSLDAAKLFLKNKPENNVQSYEKYVAVAYKFREKLQQEEINAEYLMAAAKASPKAHKLILSCRLAAVITKHLGKRKDKPNDEPRDRLKEPSDVRLLKDLEMDPLKVVGVTADADKEAIERAFKIKALTCHPDHHPEKKDEFTFLNAAKAVLIDNNQRKYFKIKDLVEPTPAQPATTKQESKDTAEAARKNIHR